MKCARRIVNVCRLRLRRTEVRLVLLLVIAALGLFVYGQAIQGSLTRLETAVVQEFMHSDDDPSVATQMKSGAEDGQSMVQVAARDSLFAASDALETGSAASYSYSNTYSYSYNYYTGEPAQKANVEANVPAKPAVVAPRDNLVVAYQAACMAYSLHQSIALDFSWKAVKNPGRLVRIVCGCETQQDMDRLRASPLEGDPRFSVYFSRDWNSYVTQIFPEAKGDNYHAYNHPYGIMDWLQKEPPAEEYVAYLEPDMVFTAPFLYHIPESEGGMLPQVSKGHPVAQNYHYVQAYCPLPCAAGDPGWAEFAIPEVCGDQCPPPVQPGDNGKYWSVGPPTILHKHDWEKLAPFWSNYSITVRNRGRTKSNGVAWLGKGAKVYIAEMLAYSLAAATAGLPHQVVRDITADSMDPCQYSGYGQARCEVPRLIHYCYPQNTEAPYGGRWIWNKYRMPMGYGQKGPDSWTKPLFWDCDFPLLEEPPEPSAEDERLWAKYKAGKIHHIWMIREIIRHYNGGHLEVKRKRCEGQKIETRKLVRVTEETAFIPSSSMEGQEPLAERMRYLVRSDVVLKGWKAGR